MRGKGAFLRCAVPFSTFLRVRGAVGRRRRPKGTLGRDNGPKRGNQKAGKATFPGRRPRNPPGSATFRARKAGTRGKRRKSQKLHWYSERVSGFRALFGPFWAPKGPRKPEPGKHPGTSPAGKGPERPEKGRKQPKTTPNVAKRSGGILQRFGPPLGPETGPFWALWARRAQTGKSWGPRLAARRVWGPTGPGGARRGPKGPKEPEKGTKQGKAAKTGPRGPIGAPWGPKNQLSGPEGRNPRKPASPPP